MTRDGSRDMRTRHQHIPREAKSSQGNYFTSDLVDGVYRLREAFVGSKVDRRTSGPGFSTPDGFKAGTRFRIEPAVWLERDDKPTVGYRQITAPWTSGATGFATFSDGKWFTPIPEDVARLFGLLVLDESLETWLDVELGNAKYQHGCGDEVLLALLESGIITKQDVMAAKAKVSR